MATGQRIGENPSSDSDQEKALTPASQSDEVIEQHRQPAKLPAYSQAAAAQRLADAPEPPVRGVTYDAAHIRQRPPGWYMKRYFKRKNLRETNSRIAATTRTSTRTMIPVAFSIFSVFLVAIILFVAFQGLTNATNKTFQNNVVTLQDILPKDNMKIYDAQGDLVYQAADQGIQTSLPLNKISPNLVNAEISIEDEYFWNNPGYDITGIVRAAIEDITNHGVVSGGSTITQQLIKNAIVGNKDTALRKLQEIILAPQVTRYYTKQQIMDMYLNTTYYGSQSYGAEAAATTYFGLKDTPRETAAQQLDIAQAATLAGIPSNPTLRNPILYPKNSITRTIQVLQQMYTLHYITAQQKAAAIEEIQQPNFIKPTNIPSEQATTYVNYVITELDNDLHVKTPDLSRSGLTVKTALNLKLQNYAQQDAKLHIDQMMQQGHNMTDASVVVMDQHTGEISAIVGNIDPSNPDYGQFNVATQGYRQPGSSMKPYYYATAFQEGLANPGTIVDDAPLTVQLCCGLPAYTPTNYSMTYNGPVTLRKALDNSLNIPAVKVEMMTGVDAGLQTAEKMMGITPSTQGNNAANVFYGTPNITTILGSLSIRLLDNTEGYATFANGGVRVPYHAVDLVTDQEGNVIYKPNTTGTRVLSQAAAFMMTSVLSDNSSRYLEFGQCSSLYLYTNTTNQCYAGNPGTIYPAAAKTGTSNSFVDNWTMGYTPRYTVGVWAGNNNNSPMVNVTGVDGAGPIWHDVQMYLNQGKPVLNFPGPPSTVVKVNNDWALKK
ncbi:MAG TPA: transglycosylase domain-containing protein [Dictyobacter sp.]|jgi:penicillin-binding protein 1A|nr:transglycosylase domain-containing protein [Dictyobacter sp.]